MTTEQLLDKLKELTVKHECELIKEILETPRENSKQKGDLLELYMKELYEGNGWICYHKGGRDDKGADLLLADPRTPKKIEHIIQTKNYNKPLGFKETRSELIQFEEVAQTEYSCNDYKLVSINGYTGTVEEMEMLNKIQLFNISLLSFTYIKQLIKTYNPDKTNLKPTMVLFSHNEVSYNSVLNTWQHSNKAAVVMATGTGKSKVAIKLFRENFSSKKKLVLAPTRYILNQFKNDPDAWGIENIKFLTYAKLNRLTPNELEQLRPEIIVCDEFHRCGSKKWLKNVQNLIRINEDRGVKSLGLSATPVRTDKKDMSAILFDNNIANALTVQEAIITGKLPMPIYVSGMCNMDQESEKLKDEIIKSNNSKKEKDFLFDKIDKATIDWEKSHGASEIIKKYIKSKNGKGIVFCEDSKHLFMMEELVRTWFKKAGFMIKTNIVISKDPEHNKEFEEFKKTNPKNKIHLLFCINKLSEGVHIPLDYVFFLRKTSSEIVYLQQLGRVLQTGRKGTPIVFDFVSNFQNVKNNHFLQNLYYSLEETDKIRMKLGLHNRICTKEYINGHIYDETIDIQEVFENIKNNLISTWEVQFNKVEKYYKENGHCNIPYNYNNDKSLTYWVTNQRTQHRLKILTADRIKKLESIKFVWNAIDEAWMKNYRQLIEYSKINGHTNVPKNHKNNSSLGNWVSYQRFLYKKKKLSNEKIECLNEISFVWDQQDEEWYRMLNLTEKLIKKEILLNTQEAKACSTWATRQRKLYKQKELDSFKIELLNGIGFAWDPLEEEWLFKYNKLIEYYNMFGNSNVPSTYHDKGLAQWVSDHRKLYKKKKITKHRIALLDKLDFEWDLKNSLWRYNYDKLIQYYIKYGTPNVPRRYKTDPSLGQWVNEQRKSYRTNRLSSDRIALLNEVNFSWDPKNDKWEQIYKQAREFFDNNGHLNIPKNYELFVELNAWINKQQDFIKLNKLDINKLEKLKRINLY